MKYNITELLDQLVEHEGLELMPYEDSLGIETIGIGRNLKDRGVSEEELGHMGKDITSLYEWGLTKETGLLLSRE